MTTPRRRNHPPEHGETAASPRPATAETTRRSFVLSVLSVAGLSGVGGASFACRRRVPPEETARRLALALGESEEALVIGEAYLASRTPAPTFEEWVGELRAALGEPPGEAKAEELRAQLAERIRDDFEAERIARVEGWLLSETEAGLCALAALLAQQARQQKGR